MPAYLSELFNLAGKTAAVIGGGGHLCSEMATAMANCGVTVALLDKNTRNLKIVAGKIKRCGAAVSCARLDVTDRNAHQKALADIIRKFGRLDILINGAGINAPTPFFRISQKEWQSILDVHMTGTFLACQVFGKYMVEHRRGSIINISSSAAGPPLSKAFTYSVAKAGIKNLTQNLAREWAPFGVRVNALRPGFFPTDWSRKHFITPSRGRAILRHTPVGRYGKPSELAGAVLWLASDAASFVTGAEITVDGGFSCMTI